MGHVIGIGTLWDNNDLITGDLVYNGANAKRVWKDWGCVSNSPPIEKDGGPGTRGGHWDEDCLGKLKLIVHNGHNPPFDL